MTAPRPDAGPSDRWFRTHPDSSVHGRPRLFARSLLDAADLDDRVARYERLLGRPAELRMPIPDFGGLELAAVGNLLLIASVRPFTAIQRRTAFSFIVPSLAGQLETVRRAGGTVVEPPEDIVPGSRARVRFPDGAVAELVEHRPRPGEKPAPPAGWPGSAPGTAPTLLARHRVPRPDFAASVALYETLLERPAGTRTLPREDGSVAAVVGDLLIVGDDGPGPADGAAACVALLAPGPVRVPGAAPAGPGGLARLPDGVLAEVWERAPLGV